MANNLNTWFLGVIVVISIGAIAFLFIRQLRKEKVEQYNRQREHMDPEALVAIVKERMYQLTTSRFEPSTHSKEAYEREMNRRIELKKALKGCTNGSINDKMYIVSFIKDMLQDGLVSKEEADKVISFHRPGFLTAKDKFDILMYDYDKRYNSNGLETLIEEEGWHILKEQDKEEKPMYKVTAEDVDKAYANHPVALTYEDKLWIIAQRIYEQYKGFGVIDKIKDMGIDGLSGGVSGRVDMQDGLELNLIKPGDYVPRNFDSIWIFYKGTSIHFSFLSFGNERELKRICQNIYRYNKAGQLSEDVGYKVNDMRDGSRVVVVRPPFSESWAFFIRKFHLSSIELKDLFQDTGSQKLIQLLTYLMKGERITAITGSQGSGKTTLLMSLIAHIDPTLTLRVQEMAFELHLRKRYPYRNILTFRETDTVSGQAGLDLQKKTDGSVNILGEVATDEISVLMLQTAQVASQFTLFTHHAKTLKDLVLSLRNSLLKCDVFRDEAIAEEQVVRVLDFEIHLNRDVHGHRYIERISEIEPLAVSEGFSRDYADKIKMGEKVDAFMNTMVDYFERQSFRKFYRERVICRYENGSYIFEEAISEEQASLMASRMEPDDREAFLAFNNRVGGERTDALYYMG